MALRALEEADPLEVQADNTLRARQPTEEESTSFATAVRARRSVRARFTRKMNETLATMSQDLSNDATWNKLSQEWQDLDEIHAELLASNAEVLPLLLRCAIDQFDEAMERVAAYNKQYTQTVNQLKAKTSALQPMTPAVPGLLPVQQQAFQTPARPIKLQKFSGDFKKFREWWQLFKVHVHDKPMDPIEKFTLLKEALAGAPSLEIAHLEFSAAQYQEAIDIIEKRFGCPRAAEKEHLQELRKICSARDLHNNDKFFHFVSSLSQNVKALLSLGKSISSISMAISQDVLRCLPRSMSEDFTRKNFKAISVPNGSDDELKLLIEYLENEVAVKRACGSSGSQAQSSSASIRFTRDSSSSNSSRQFNQRPNGWKSRQNEASGSSVNLLAKNAEVDHSCIFCSSPKHESKACKKALSHNERRELCDRSNACFRCLRRNHIAKKCRAKNVKCERCSRGHYTIMCNSDQAPGRQIEQFSTQVEIGRPNNTLKGLVFFQTGLVWVNCASGRKIFRFFIDSGSERSYVSDHVVKSLNLKPVCQESLAMITIGGNVSEFKKHNVYEIGLQSRFDDKMAIKFTATGLPEIARGNFPVSPESWDLSPLADHAENIERREIDVLIGWDVIPKIKCGAERVFEDRMVANSTIFGWVIAGMDESRSGNMAAQVFVTANLYQPGTRLSSSQVISMATIAVGGDHLSSHPSSGSESSSSSAHLKTEGIRDPSEATDTECLSDIKSDLQVLWSTEILGIESPSDNSEQAIEAELQNFFQNHIKKLKDGRYMVSLPFKENLRTLGDNENVARGSLKRFLFKAARNRDLLAAVDKEMKQYIEKGYAEPAVAKKAGELVHYLPILPVIKRDANKKLVKVRVVKDAGARRKDEAALNDVLHDGANLLPDTFKVLLRFRKDEIAIVSDIEKAFLQYKVDPNHRTFLRFFWPLGIGENPQAPVREFWSTTLDFGISASPFIHCAGIRFHLRQLLAKHPEKAALLKDLEEHFYMDDLVVTATNGSEGWKSFDFMFKAFSAGGFRLRKWATNDAKLGRRIKESLNDPEVEISFEQENFKFLGIGWNLSSDELHISVSTAIETLEAHIPSKRTLLKGTAQIYDPLGFISPLTIKPKILLQSLWKQNLNWDDRLAGENLEKFVEATDTLKAAQHFRIQRNINTNTHDVTRELHVFCDSSLSALGCVAYVREIANQGGAKVFFLASKARVVPLKANYSIHKLELVGAVMAARIGAKIKKSLNFHFVSTNYWCDNSPTLHWIKDAPEGYKAFVANRIKEIQSLTNPADWNFVVSGENPADFLSRGIDIASNEFSSMWLQGPGWLAKAGCPTTKHSLNELFEKEARSERKVTSMLTAEPECTPVIDGSRLSSWRVLVNSTARILRWLAARSSPIRQFPFNAPVTAEESLQATTRIIKIIQGTHFKAELETRCSNISKESRLFKLAPFMDAEGLIRCHSRLERSEEFGYDEKFPIVLPGEMHAVRLLVRFFHERKCFHVGGIAATMSIIRKKYYILSARRVVKSVYNVLS